MIEKLVGREKVVWTAVSDKVNELIEEVDLIKKKLNQTVEKIERNKKDKSSL